MQRMVYVAATEAEKNCFEWKKNLILRKTPAKSVLENVFLCVVTHQDMIYPFP